jgi:hypothetical protein
MPAQQALELFLERHPPVVFHLPGDVAADRLYLGGAD